jgi:NUMOD4 motif
MNECVKIKQRQLWEDSAAKPAPRPNVRLLARMAAKAGVRNANYDNEQWRAIVGYEGLYEVSDKGRIKSLSKYTAITKYKRKERIIKPICVGAGYFRVALRKNNIREDCYIAHIVAKAFIPNPENKPEVNHIKGENKWDNSIANLEWMTRNENVNHAIQNGLMKIPRRRRKISSLETVMEIRRKLEAGAKNKDMAVEYGVNKTIISSLSTGRYMPGLAPLKRKKKLNNNLDALLLALPRQD